MFKTTAAALLAAGVGPVAAKEFVIQEGTTATMVMGVGVASEVETVAAAAQNGVGAEIESYNGQKWTKQYLPAGTLMDAAIMGQTSVAVSMWAVLLSNDGGTSYTTAENIKGLSQSCSVFGSGSDIGLVGSFTTSSGVPPVSGVAHSADAGASWDTSEVPIGMVRYGAFPSQNTWFVTSGMWGDSSVEQNEKKSISPMLSVSKSGSVTLQRERVMAGDNSTSTESGWWGAISKTTDGGATWSTVFHSEPTDVYYFNAISCSSETHCVAVAEGDEYLAYVTFDGGDTWKETFNSAGDAPDNMVSMMGAAWENDEIGWVAGVAKDGRTLSGLFYKTEDGGDSWTLQQSLDNCYPIDIDFAGDAGAAACLSSSGSSGSVALYM